MLGDLVRQMKRVVAASLYFFRITKSVPLVEGAAFFSKTIPVQPNG